MKKALCILLSLIMLLSASTTAFASEMIDKSFCIDDYNQYTIKLLMKRFIPVLRQKTRLTPQFRM